MSEQNIFETATRKKLRFESTKGLLSVEDLWDLPLRSTRGASLDKLAGEYDKQRENVTKSYVEPTIEVDEEAKLSFDIIMHIIKVRLEEVRVRSEAKARKEKKAKIMAIIESKEDSALEGLSIEDLRKQLDAL
jgi:hypothetical protein